MTRYSLSWLFLAIIVAVSSFHDDFTSRLSQSEIYKILLGMVVVCFAVGKIWPNLFNKKDTNIQPSSSVGKEVKEDAEYYVRHKKLTVFSPIYESRSFQSQKAFRPDARCGRCVVLVRFRSGHRFRWPKRSRENHDDANSGYVG